MWHIPVNLLFQRSLMQLLKSVRNVHKNRLITSNIGYREVPWCFETYLLTPYCRVLVENLTGFQLVKKFPAFYGTRRFITAFTSARHLSLSWARSLQSMPDHTPWRFILMSSSHLRLCLPSGLLLSGFPTKTLHTLLFSPYVLHAPLISLFSIWSSEKYLLRGTENE